MKVMVAIFFVTCLVGFGGKTNSFEYVGDYSWGEKTTRPLTATFTLVSAESNTWNVVFDALYQKTIHQYVGIATGSLTNKLSGKAKMQKKNRWRTFKTSYTNGVLRGQHWDTGKKYTGTFKLVEKDAESKNQE